MLEARGAEAVRVLRGAVSAGVAAWVISLLFWVGGVCAVGSLVAVAAFLVALLRGAAGVGVEVAGVARVAAFAGGITGASPGAVCGVVAVLVLLAVAVDAARRRGVDVVGVMAAGFVSGSGLPVVALSDFERALARVFVAAGLTCSFSSVVSDVSFMKKTSLYRIMRHKWRRKSLFTATTKDCRLFPYLTNSMVAKRKRGQSLAGVVPGMF